MAWAFEDAKARFKEVVRRAQSEGPQHVSVSGEPSVVVMTEAEFARLSSTPPDPKDNLRFDQHLLAEPAWPDEFVDAIVNRPKDYGRDIDL